MGKCRIIVISHMFPNNINSASGIFVKEQVKAIKRLVSNEILVISPVPYSPRVLWLRKKWHDYGKVWRESNEDNIRIIYPRYIVFPSANLFFLQGFTMFITLLMQLKRIVKPKDQFIIHCHTILPDGLAVAILRKFYPNMRSICTIHGSDINIYPFRTKLTMKYTRYSLIKHDQIITVSNALKKKVLEVSSIPPNRVATVTNGVNLKRFNKKGSRTKKEGLERFGLCYDSEIKYILFVGNLLKEKGVFELLKAIEILSQNNINIRLVCVGDGPEREALKNTCVKYGLQNKVCFTGMLLHDEVSLLMCSCDIFILPSYSEGMPTVMFEAMACSLPIIISNVGGVSEIIQDGENGLLIKPKATEDIVSSVIKILDSPQLARDLGSRAYETIQQYKWEDNAKYMEEIFIKLN